MKRLSFCFALLAASFTHSTLAQENGRAVMERSEQATKSQTESAHYLLELLDSDGSLVQARKMEFFFQRKDGQERTLIKFNAPPVMAGTGLLIEDRNEAANDIWLYLPATRKLRRIAGAEKSNWFMGTEFTHEDFEDYQIPRYAFERMPDAPCQAGHCYVISASPSQAAEQAASGYSKKVYWIDQKTLYPVMIDYFDRDGKHTKHLETAGISPYASYWRPQQIEMTNFTNGRKTRLTVESREVDAALDDYYVSKRYLRAD